MLLDAKILIRSAPSAFSFRTVSRIWSTVNCVLVIARMQVRMRGPGRTPRATAPAPNASTQAR
jgi:hypothetical protein